MACVNCPGFLSLMIALLQRVSEARVLVNEEMTGHTITGEIGRGILALIGVEKGDSDQTADRLLERIISYRVFPDGDGRMNLDLRQASGALLLVPQFTLAANTGKGNRASFTSAASPEEGKRLFDYLLLNARNTLGQCGSGRFGAHMQVELVNDGPVTFWLQVPPHD